MYMTKARPFIHNTLIVLGPFCEDMHRLFWLACMGITTVPTHWFYQQEEPLVPMFICPSIAPSNYNNPGYYVFHISPLHEVDYDHYALNIEAANMQHREMHNSTELASFDCLYRFSQRYRPWLGLRALPTAQNIAHLYEHMLNDDFVWYQVRAATTSMLSERRLDFLQMAVDKAFMDAYNLSNSN